MSGHGYGVRRLDDDEIGKASLHMRRTHRAAEKAHVFAMDGLPAPAESTLPAGRGRIDGDERSYGGPRNAYALGDNVTGYLVPKDHRLAQAHVAETTMPEVMQVRAANPASGDAYQNLSHTGLGPSPLFHAQITLRVQHYRTHFQNVSSRLV